MSDTQEHIYKVLFHNQGQIYEVYAHSIYQSDLYGFIEIEDYIFGERTKVVIDPGEDKLRQEFEAEWGDIFAAGPAARMVGHEAWAAVKDGSIAFMRKYNVKEADIAELTRGIESQT